MLADALAAAIEVEAEAAAAAVRARRHVDALLAEHERPTAPAEQPTLLGAAELAKRLGVSVAHVRRLDPPHVVVGDESTRRYDLDTVRGWLFEREPKATTPARKTTTDAVDVGAILSRGGLRAVAGSSRGAR